jgi:hypothetical protein
MLNCPFCHGTRIHRSRRRGIYERRILSLIFVRPFRCEDCDFRFFRWSFATNTTAAQPITQ